MKSLTSIIAVNHQRALGYKNRLPWRLKSDLRFFRRETLGHVVIMGRKTWQSTLGSLPERDNLILSRDTDFVADVPACSAARSKAGFVADVAASFTAKDSDTPFARPSLARPPFVSKHCDSIAAALALASQQQGKDVFVIGGASIYAQFAPLVDRYLITLVDMEVHDADAFLAEEAFGNIAQWNAIEGWDKEVLGRYPAKPGSDEAPFTIYQWTAHDREARARRRETLIARAESQAAQYAERPVSQHNLQGKEHSLQASVGHARVG